MTLPVKCTNDRIMVRIQSGRKKIIGSAWNVIPDETAMRIHLIQGINGTYLLLFRNFIGAVGFPAALSYVRIMSGSNERPQEKSFP